MPDIVSAPSPSPEPSPGPRVWFVVGPVAVTTGRLFALMLFLGAVIALAVGWRQIDVEMIHARARELPGWAVFAVICAAPMVGVPAALLHVAAGVRFGTWAGFTLIAVATAIHHVLGYSLVKLAPRVFSQRLALWRQRFPRGAHRPITIFACLLPGMPYSIQIYLLPLIGVPLRVLLTVSAPIHTIRALVSILGGAWSAEVTPAKLMALLGYYLLLSGICAWMIRRIRAELKRRASSP